MKDTILVIVIAVTVSFFATNVYAGSMSLGLSSSAALSDNEPEAVSNEESNLDKLKRWSKMIRGKEPIYTTTRGVRFNVDAIGGEKSITLFKTF